MAFTQFLQGQRNRFKKSSGGSSSSPASASAKPQPSPSSSSSSSSTTVKPAVKPQVKPQVKQTVKPVPMTHAASNGSSSSSTSSSSWASAASPMAPEALKPAPMLAPSPLGLDPINAAPDKAPPMVHTMSMSSRSSSSPSTEYVSPPASPRGNTRRLSERMKATPSSLHRHSRLFTPNSGAANGGDNLGAAGAGASGASRASASHASFTKQMTEALPPPLRPIVTLLHAHRLRIYNVGVFQVPGYTADGERVWLEVEAKLTGTELAIWRPHSDDEDSAFTEFKPKYVNMVDAKINVVGEGSGFELRIQTDYAKENDVVIRFSDSKDYVKWIAAMYLCQFEHVSLNEAFTAVMLSQRGAQLSDIHVLLAQKKRFPTEEWCNLRLPQISDRWIKVFVVVIPGDSKHLGRMEIYSSDKVSKRNLVAYVSKLDQAYNVYPESPAMIDFNAIMNLRGEVYVNKHFEHLFDSEFTPPQRSFTLKSMTRSDSWHSLSSLKSDVTPPATPKHHRRTNSNSSTSSASFFSQAPSPQPIHHNGHKKKSSSRRLRSATLGEADVANGNSATPKRTSSFVRKNLDQFATTSYFYLMPLTHPGVPAIETMIRNYIHIIDAFKLYGRPRQLASDKSDPQSLLFALPSLPHYQYISRDASTKLVDKKLTPSIGERWDDQRWRHEFKQYLKDRVLQGYRGHGDVSKLYQNLDYSVFDVPFSPTLPDEGYSESAYTLSPPSYSRSSTPVDNSNNGHLAVDLDYDKTRRYTASPLSASYRV